MRWFISMPISAALSILLSGCLFSKAPLLTAANSDRPLPAHFSISPAASPEDSGSAELTGDNVYVFDDPKGGGSKETARFKKIGDNLYAASGEIILHSTGELLGYRYGYMRVSPDGRKVSVHWPECKAFDAAEIEKMGVKIEKENDESSPECHIPSVEVLETLIKSYINDPKNAEQRKLREDEGTFIITTR